MNRKLLRVIVFVLGTALTLLFIHISGILSFGIWIYLAWIIWKKKINVFKDKVEPVTADKNLKRLKALLTAAGISFLVFIVSIITHNFLSKLYEHEFVSFSLTVIALYGFVLATLASLLIFLKGRRSK